MDNIDNELLKKAILTKKKYKMELGAVRNCMNEAFWSRSIPCGSASALAALSLIKTGKINPQTRFGAIQLVVGVGSLGYLIGKCSFIFSDKCKDIFLEKAPESAISERIRIDRGEHQKQTLIANSSQILANTVLDNELLKKELGAVRNCMNEAFWSRSIPCGSASTLAALFLIKTGKINPQTRFGAIELVVGVGSLGYLIGKCSFIFSDKCKDIFLEKAPESAISERIRIDRGEHYKQTVVTDSSQPEPLEEPVVQQENQDYVYPDIEEDLSTRIRDEWTNHLRPSTKI